MLSFYFLSPCCGLLCGLIQFAEQISNFFFHISKQAESHKVVELAWVVLHTPQLPTAFVGVDVVSSGRPADRLLHIGLIKLHTHCSKSIDRGGGRDWIVVIA